MNRNLPSDKSRPFDIALWKRASAKKRRVREQLRLNVLDNVWKSVGQLKNKYKWDELYLFGSITKPEKFSERSDIEIGIQGLEKVLHYRFIADLSELLEWGIDVVRLEDCSFAEVIKTRGIVHSPRQAAENLHRKDKKSIFSSLAKRREIIINDELSLLSG